MAYRHELPALSKISYGVRCGKDPCSNCVWRKLLPCLPQERLRALMNEHQPGRTSSHAIQRGSIAEASTFAERSRQATCILEHCDTR